MTRTTVALITALALSFPGLAIGQDVPERIAFNARLTNTAGDPLSGSHVVNFALFDVVTGGAALWSEGHSATSFSAEGLAFMELGDLVPLTPAIVDGRALYLEVTVDGVAMSPRLPVASVPYALRATQAARLGTLTPADVQRRVSSACTVGSSIRSIAADGTVECEAYLPASWLPNWAEVGSKPAGLVMGPLACSGTDKVTGVSAAGALVCAADQSVDQATVEGWSLAFASTISFNGALNANGNVVLGNAAADTVRFNAVAASALDMNNNVIQNIGNAGTDFTATGGLNLAGELACTGCVNTTGLLDDTVRRADISGTEVALYVTPTVCGGNSANLTLSSASCLTIECGTCTMPMTEPLYYSCNATCPGSGVACGPGQNGAPVLCPVTLAGYLLSPTGL